MLFPLWEFALLEGALVAVTLGSTNLYYRTRLAVVTASSGTMPTGRLAPLNSLFNLLSGGGLLASVCLLDVEIVSLTLQHPPFPWLPMSLSGLMVIMGGCAAIQAISFQLGLDTFIDGRLGLHEDDVSQRETAQARAFVGQVLLTGGVILTILLWLSMASVRLLFP